MGDAQDPNDHGKCVTTYPGFNGVDTKKWPCPATNKVRSGNSPSAAREAGPNSVEVHVYRERLLLGHEDPGRVPNCVYLRQGTQVSVWWAGLLFAKGTVRLEAAWEAEGARQLHGRRRMGTPSDSVPRRQP